MPIPLYFFRFRSKPKVQGANVFGLIHLCRETSSWSHWSWADSTCRWTSSAFHTATYTCM